mgnify:FL=1
MSFSELMRIFMKLAWEVDSEDLSIAALYALGQLVDFPRQMKPYFGEILRRAEEAILTFAVSCFYIPLPHYHLALIRQNSASVAKSIVCGGGIGQSSAANP